MAQFNLRRRHPVNKREARTLNAALAEAHGLEFSYRPGEVELAQSPTGQALLRDGRVIAFERGDRWHLAVRGLLELAPPGGWVQVDMGAVPFLRNGANVMAAGINDVAEAVTKGDLVWVREENHQRPLAVGEASMDGAEMVASARGMAVKTLHHIGDTVWDFGGDD
uniref:Universal PUA-domain-containing protein n=2 Tax=environmental samples TaxID=68359 RepID=A0A075GIS0_9EURY|nr:universal PUA-domain-containing protein [uncultured marine group II/III euryarchaeote KM3_148_H03]AIF07378.1 universal PUA-domain-containing protein [uncultured marine group II/III euryarchaeote KM3_202_G05]